MKSTIHIPAFFLCAMFMSFAAMADIVPEARIHKIDVADAPLYIQQQAKAIITQCSSSENYLSQVTIYQHINTANKQDNYILDFSALTNQTKQQTECSYHSPLCGPKGCFIMAYTQNNKKDWDQTWFAPALKMKIIDIVQSNKSFPAVEIMQVAENCMTVNEGKEPCPTHFTWLDKKFKYYGTTKLEDIEAGTDGNAAPAAPPAEATPVEDAAKPADNL